MVQMADAASKKWYAVENGTNQCIRVEGPAAFIEDNESRNIPTKTTDLEKDTNGKPTVVKVNTGFSGAFQATFYTSRKLCEEVAASMRASQKSRLDRYR